MLKISYAHVSADKSSAVKFMVHEDGTEPHTGKPFDTIKEAKKEAMADVRAANKSVKAANRATASLQKAELAAAEKAAKKAAEDKAMYDSKLAQLAKWEADGFSLIRGTVGEHKTSTVPTEAATETAQPQAATTVAA